MWIIWKIKLNKKIKSCKFIFLLRVDVRKYCIFILNVIMLNFICWIVYVCFAQLCKNKDLKSTHVEIYTNLFTWIFEEHSIYSLDEKVFNFSFINRFLKFILHIHKWLFSKIVIILPLFYHHNFTKRYICMIVFPKTLSFICP